MAGLLDFLSSEQAAPGLLMLASGGGNLGGVAQGLLQSQFATEDRKAKKEAEALRQQYVRSQIAENDSQNMTRAAQMQRAAQAQAAEQAYYQSRAGGGAGFVQPAAGGGGTSGGSLPPGSIGPYLEQLSKEYKIPIDALANDYFKNGGKGISEMVFKRGTPDMQVSNGYAYDKNNLGAGFMPSLQTSQDGKSTMTRIGPDGLPIVSAPQGALETFRGYQGAAADYDLAKVFNPATGREEYRTRGQIVGGAATPPAPLRAQTQPGVMSPAYAGGDRDKANAESIQIMLAEQRRAMNPEDKAAIGREIARLQQQSGMPQGTPMQPQSGAYAAGPSMMEQAQAKAAETRAVNTAAADVVRDTGQRADTKRAGQLTSGVDRAIDLLKQGPTSSLLGVGIDKALGAAGMSTKGADTAAQLETLSGWLTANVPRMEGPQSNADVENYRTQAAAVGNPTKPISQRLAAAEEVKRLQQKYADLNASPAQSTAPQQAVPRVPMKGQVLQGYRFKGGNPADQANWEKM